MTHLQSNNEENCLCCGHFRKHAMHLARQTNQSTVHQHSNQTHHFHCILQKSSFIYLTLFWLQSGATRTSSSVVAISFTLVPTLRILASCSSGAHFCRTISAFISQCQQTLASCLLVVGKRIFPTDYGNSFVV